MTHAHLRAADPDPVAGQHSVIARAFLIAYLAALAVLVVYAIINGAEVRAALDRESAGQIAEENRAVCQEFAQQAGTADLSLCTQRLNEIRARHKERVLRDLSPVL